METLTLSQSIFDQKTKEAIDLQPMRRQISMHEVELLSMEKVRVQGAELTLSKQARLLKEWYIATLWIRVVIF